MEQPSGLRVSHEAIYTALYGLPRGELRRELLSYLRQAKPVRGRKPKGSERRGKLCNMTNIKERPEEIEGRLVPGHWEGDLILGAGGASAVGTLVERTTRLVVLVHMPTRKAEVAASAFAGALNAIPAPLRKTLTYDQGKEMAGHAGLAAQTGMRIFFADPHSPWQRGANENTNGLLRQYLPKGSSLARLDQSDLDLVAASLNDRPRKTLDYATPNEAFNSLLAKLVSGGKTPNGGAVRYRVNPPPQTPPLLSVSWHPPRGQSQLTKIEVGSGEDTSSPALLHPAPSRPGRPMRPSPGSFTAGRRRSKPATAPSRFISTPSTQASVIPA